MRQTLCLVIGAALLLLPLPASSRPVLADPDCASTHLEINTTPAVALGDYLSLGGFTAGAMLEVRNESRFNQGFLPNHVWRGFLSLLYGFTPVHADRGELDLDLGYEHESAHPTGGLGTGDRAYEMIYDSTYRNVNLNSVLVRLRPVFLSGRLVLQLDGRFYFLSRNVPELPGTRLTEGGGMAAGVEYRHPLNDRWALFLSVYDRVIFHGCGESTGDVYYDAGAPVLRTVRYPLLNGANLFEVKAGALWMWEGRGRDICLYTRLLYGTLPGFTDSRDHRFMWYLGVEMVNLFKSPQPPAAPL